LSYRLLIIFSIAALVAASAAAEGARASLVDPQLETLVGEALANAPEMRSARATLEASRRRIAPASTLRDPFLSTTWQNDGRALSLGSAEGSFVGLMASQELPWPGKLRLAGEIAAAEAKEVESGPVARAALTIESRVRNAWYELTLARAVDRILDDRRKAAAQIEAAVRDRYAAGLAVQQDVLRAQIELVRLDERKSAQAATIASRLAELNRLAGAPLDRQVETPAALPDSAAVPPYGDLVAANAARSPELASAQQSIETGKLRTDLARKNFYPDFTVSGGSMYRRGLEMGPMWQVGAGISVPLWIERRQQNELAEAEAIVAARQADTETVRRELELRTLERVAQLESSLRIAALYRDKVLPLDEISLESALASYRAGKVPFITVLDALNTLYSDRAAYQGRLAESAKWRVAIDEASLQPVVGPAMSSDPRATTSSSSMTSMR
jgi:outer membrane protein TolC